MKGYFFREESKYKRRSIRYLQTYLFIAKLEFAYLTHNRLID